MCRISVNVSIHMHILVVYILKIEILNIWWPFCNDMYAYACNCCASMGTHILVELLFEIIDKQIFLKDDRIAMFRGHVKIHPFGYFRLRVSTFCIYVQCESLHYYYHYVGLRQSILFHE